MGKYLEGNYDSDNLAISSRQRMDDELESWQIEREAQELQEAAKESEEKRIKGIEENIEDVFEKYAEEDKWGQYLVNGAILTCNQAAWEPFKVPGQEDIQLEQNHIADKYTFPVGVLKVYDDEMIINDDLYATVKDTEMGKNIFPFRCNCKKAADRKDELTKIKNDPNCNKHGVCRHLMKLNEEWENLPLGKHLYKTKGAGINGEVENVKKEEIECITMMSMLFCKHGGLITPVKSGQKIRIPITWENVRELGNWSAERIKLAKYVTQKMLEQNYSLEIIAGMVGNVVNEGNFGQFESSAYSSGEPKYLEHMDEYHRYREVASDKKLFDVGIGVFELLEKTSTCKNDDKPHKYGLGAIQWTEDRCDKLVERYIERFGKNGKPTYEECQQLEIDYMLEELNGNYRFVIDECEMTINEMGEEDSVKKIAKIIMNKYEVAGTDTEKTRQEDAYLWYEVLTDQHYEEREDE